VLAEDYHEALDGVFCSTVIRVQQTPCGIHSLTPTKELMGLLLMLRSLDDGGFRPPTVRLAYFRNTEPQSFSDHISVLPISSDVTTPSSSILLRR
jgi:hypothetical protein